MDTVFWMKTCLQVQKCRY